MCECWVFHTNLEASKQIGALPVESWLCDGGSSNVEIVFSGLSILCSELIAIWRASQQHTCSDIDWRAALRQLEWFTASAESKLNVAAGYFAMGERWVSDVYRRTGRQGVLRKECCDAGV